MTTISTDSNPPRFLIANSECKIVLCGNFKDNEVNIITPYNKYQIKAIEDKLILVKADENIRI